MMRTRLSRLVVLAAVLVAPGLARAAEGVPDMDMEPSCKAAETAATILGRTGANCRSDEKSAKETVGREWQSFSAADRNHCRSLVNMGGPPSYVEFLSCLEMSRDARQIAQNRGRQGTNQPQSSETTGSAPTTP
jgi:hypothetical protein